MRSGADLTSTTIDFVDDGTLRLSPGSNVTGHIVTDTDNTGMLDFEGDSVITGSVGEAGPYLGVINLSTNDAYQVTFSSSVYVHSLEFDDTDEESSRYTFNGETHIGNDEEGDGIFTGSNALGSVVFNADAYIKGLVGDSDNELYELYVDSGTTTVSYAIHAVDVYVADGTLKLSSDFEDNEGYLDGNLTLNNNGVLDLGLNTLHVTADDTNGGGDYTQNAGSTLKLIIQDTETFGHISSEGATVSASSTIDVTTTEDAEIALGDEFAVIESSMSDMDLSSMTIIDDLVDLNFSASIVEGNLILTLINADGGSYVPSEDPTDNERHVGESLDGITDPEGDMADVMGELDALKGNQGVYRAAVDALNPDDSAGVPGGMFNTMSLASGVYTVHMDSIRSGISTGETGFAFGDKEQSKTFWAKGFGSYMKQGVVDGVNGYDATTAGTMLGIDWLATEEARFGFGAGVSNTDINNKVNAGGTTANSYQGSLYGSYQAVSSPYYVDGVLSAAYNNYEGKREILFGGINRQAKADYDGQQYSALLSGGYNFDLKGGIIATPLVSLQYAHLDLGSYTETGADALNLNVQKQRYDLLQSGLGFKLTRPVALSSGTLIPEFHAKWFHDFIADKAQATASFTGGGASFSTVGAKPEENSYNAGLGLSLISKSDWSLIANYDYEMKDAFFSHTGSMTVKLAF
jgi:outer membrane autotransporter protein